MVAFRLYIIFILIVLSKISSAQSLSIHRCLDGSRGEWLNTYDYVDGVGPVLNVRSASFDGQFNGIVTDDSLSYYFGRNFLIRLSDDGDILWKQELPGSERSLAMNFFYFPYSNYFPYYFAGMPFRSFTKVADELLIHYTVFDSVEYNRDFGTYRTVNNMLVFGKMDALTGEYSLEPFVIDTLMKIPSDSALNINQFETYLLNDSVCVLICNYSKSYRYFSGLNATTNTRIYKINLNNRFVEKSEYPYYNYRIFYNGERNYLFFDENNKLYIHKLNNQEQIVLTNNFMYSSTNSVLSVLDNGNFLVAGKRNTGNVDSVRLSAALTVIDKETLLDQQRLFNPYPQAEYVDNTAEPVLKNTTDIFPYTIDYSIYNVLNSSQDYSLVRTEAVISGQYIQEQYLLRYNRSTGDIIRSQLISPPYTYYAIDDLENVIIVKGEYTTDNVTWITSYKNHLELLNDDGLSMWNIQLPDTLRVSDRWVYAAAPANYHRALKFGNEILVSVQYNDTAGAAIPGSYQVLFRISKSDGNLNWVYLPDSITNIMMYQSFGPFIKGWLNFFNNSSGQLRILTNHPYEACQDSSDFNLVIYKLEDIISKVPVHSVNEKPQIRIFPNPASDILQIVPDLSLSETEATLEVYDLSGKLMLLERRFLNATFNLDVNRLLPGFYILSIKTEKGFSTAKFEKLK